MKTMRGAIPLLTLLAAAATGCAGAMKPGASRDDLESAGYLRYALFEYDSGPLHMVWIPTWRVTAFRAKTETDDQKTVLEFEAGRLVASTNLGTDRNRWMETLKAHGQGMDASVAGSILRKEIREGMPVEAVLLSWGVPDHSSMARSGNGTEMDGELWYRRGKQGEGVRLSVKGNQIRRMENVQQIGVVWQSRSATE